MKDFISAIFGGSIAVGLLCGLIWLLMWGCPQYSVYSAKMDGQAILAHAQSSKEVAVAEARAKMESAELLAQACGICGLPKSRAKT